MANDKKADKMQRLTPEKLRDEAADFSLVESKYDEKS